MDEKDIYASEWVRQSYNYLQKCELDALRELIWALPKGSVCVNIGAGFGTSGIAFIENPNIGKLYTIELYATEKQSTLGNLEYEMGVFQKFGFDKDPRYVPILGDSVTEGWRWNRESIDMMFIDGDHTRPEEDLDAWLPHMKKGGILAFHDYLEPRWPKVGIVIQEKLLFRYPVIAIAGTVIAFRWEEIHANQA